MSKIKVLEVLFGLQWGGVESFLYNNFLYIDRDRFDFELLTFMPTITSCEEQFLHMGILHSKPTMEAKTPRQVQRQIYEFLKKNRFDVVHAHLNEQFATALQPAKAAGVPLRIAHCHTAYNPLITETHELSTKTRPTNRQLNLYPTHFAACGPSAGEWQYGKKACDEGRVLYLNNAIDTGVFAFDEKARTKIRHELGIEDCLCVGTVARLTLQKNPLFLLEVFAEIKKLRQDAVLLHIGNHLETNTEKLFLETAENLGIRQNLIFLGEQSDVSPYYQAMDAFLLPSYFEGFGIAAIEAQAAGLPCVLSDGVPPEAAMSDSVKIIPLSKGPACWAQETLDLTSATIRCDRSDEIAKAGYDIRDSYKVLEQLYSGEI